jgi:hypothetical protein
MAPSNAGKFARSDGDGEGGDLAARVKSVVLS